MIEIINNEIIRFIPTKENIYLLKLSKHFLFFNRDKKRGEDFKLALYLKELKGGLK